MKKNTYFALLLLIISFTSGAKSLWTSGLDRRHSPHPYRVSYADTAESPDEFFRPPLREWLR